MTERPRRTPAHPLLLAAALALAVPAAAQPSAEAAPGPSRAVALQVQDAPALDGRLDDAAWRDARWISDFVLREPEEGGAPAGRTEIAFLVDDGALYVGARMHGAAPGDVVRQLARRDREGISEEIAVSLDTYRDRRTAYTFAVSSAGTRIDYHHPSDDRDSRAYSFDPVWEAEVALDSSGWTAEMRIPLSQLRFSAADEQRWGLNVVRRVPARNEEAYWILVPRDETGWSSRMGELALGALRPPRRVELVPYAAADGRLAHAADPRDPFQDTRSAGMRVGGDARMGLGPSFTLSATVNPDFGQVDADPAEVNLTQYETFFSERRPFFVEGTSLLSSRGLFYSRRIGAPPPGQPDGDYAERMDATPILGAAKLTGRTRGGLSIGALAAVTGRERVATYDTAADAFGAAEVAPPTGYGIAAVQQELGRDRSTLGASLTGVRRDLAPGSPLAALVPEQAVTGLVDGRLRWAGGGMDVSAFAAFSHVTGDSLAILRLQRSSRRYFQRPDADHVEVDAGRTSLSGTFLGINHSRMRGRVLWDVDYVQSAPGLELNDLGQMGSTDFRAVNGNVRYRETRPGKHFRAYEAGMFADAGWNFGGVRTWTSVGGFASARLPDFSSVAMDLVRRLPAQSDDLTRGGPLMGTGAAWIASVGVDGRPGGRTEWEAGVDLFRSELGSWRTAADLELRFRPGPRWELSVDPRWSRGAEARQYVTTREGGPAATFGRRYVFAHLERNEVAMQIRLNYALSPDLTLETYAEPFASSGRFHGFGELPAARSRALRTYGEDGTTIVRSEETGERTVTDGADTFVLPHLDFDVRSFRSNAVLRWEWRPGSTLFVVWQQDRSRRDARWTRLDPSDAFASLGAAGDNLLAVKLTYWIPVR